MRARRTKLKGIARDRREALGLVAEPGDLALIERGKLRSIVIQCPDGCGDKLTINLDQRTGPAWRVYRERTGLTLYPSVWRTTGCRSHFILWSDHIYWMDRLDPATGDTVLEGVLAQVLAKLRSNGWMSVERLAIELDEGPWLVSRACGRLLQAGQVEESGEGDDQFRALPAD